MSLRDFERVYEPPPHDKVIWVRVIAYIRHNPTGEIRSGEDTMIWNEDGDCPETYNYEMGNFSCDCNRRIFYERFSGKAVDFENNECGKGEFSVRLVNPKTGDIFYDELGEDEDYDYPTPEDIKEVLDRCAEIEARGGPQTTEEVELFCARGFIQGMAEDARKPSFFDRLGDGLGNAVKIVVKEDFGRGK